MRNNKQFGISGKGYYIALILCAAAIGISGYLYHRNVTQAEEVAIWDTEETAAPAAVQIQEDVAVIATRPASEPTVPGAAAPAETAPAATQPPAKRTLKTASPLEGEQIADYSMDCLSYNATTRDWRVHNGIDIAAPEGTEVCAAADGTVDTAYEDDTMGSTVVIRHANGYTTRYSSLGQELAVKAGDRVTMGQTIGFVGTTALAETALGSHIHFSVTSQDSPMDPGEFLNMG